RKTSSASSGNPSSGRSFKPAGRNSSSSSPFSKSSMSFLMSSLLIRFRLPALVTRVSVYDSRFVQDMPCKFSDNSFVKFGLKQSQPFNDRLNLLAVAQCRFNIGLRHEKTQFLQFTLKPVQADLKHSAQEIGMGINRRANTAIEFLQHIRDF